MPKQIGFSNTFSATDEGLSDIFQGNDGNMKQDDSRSE
jgi:hypothetical protein